MLTLSSPERGFGRWDLDLPDWTNGGPDFEATVKP